MKKIKIFFNILIIQIILFSFNDFVKAERGINGEEFDSGIYDQVCQYNTEGVDIKDADDSVDVQIGKNLNWAESLIYKFNGKKTLGLSGSTNVNHENVVNWEPNVNKKYAEKKQEAINNKKCSNGTCPSICPTYVMVAHNITGYHVYVAWTKKTLENWASEKKYSNYKITKRSGSRQATTSTTEDNTNTIQGNPDQGSTSGSDYKDSNDNNHTPSTENPITSCESVPQTIGLLKKIYNFLKYMVPVIIIGLGMLDFIKAITSDDEKVFKEAWSKLMKRIMIGVVILILPVIIKMLITISGVSSQIGISKDDLFCIFFD